MSLCCCCYSVRSRFLVYVVCFFFFKQKTAYEMRISDRCSDVCSSDLCAAQLRNRRRMIALLPEHHHCGIQRRFFAEFSWSSRQCHAEPFLSVTKKLLDESQARMFLSDH